MCINSHECQRHANSANLPVLWWVQSQPGGGPTMDPTGSPDVIFSRGAEISPVHNQCSNRVCTQLVRGSPISGLYRRKTRKLRPGFGGLAELPSPPDCTAVFNQTLSQQTIFLYNRNHKRSKTKLDLLQKCVFQKVGCIFFC